jgi:glycosyltransferase involved in cell wall biosynthesis
MTTRANGDGPRVLIGAMLKWYLHHTAKAFETRGALSGYWVSNANVTGVGPYRRVWPYHLLKKPFYYLPFMQLEELTRWWFLPAYDGWVARQEIPGDCNVVMGPMGSCESLFRLADSSDRRVLKVFDAPNSHPACCAEAWQDECDDFMPGYRIPFPGWAVERAAREIKAADLVLCPSDFVKESMVSQGVPAVKCHVRHFGVDSSIFRPREEIPASPVFISTGSICLRKGHQYLFRAFARLKETRPDARLVCIGGVRPDFAAEWSAWRGLIEHHPFLPHAELAEKLRGATAFVLASVEEGFARVLSEAMAAGLPLIATHESGATTVLVDGLQGVVVPARDVERLHDAMKRLAEDRELNRRMGAAALEAGAARNSWQDYGDDLLRCLTGELKARH